MRIIHSNDRTYSVHFKSLFSFEIPWQALCLATAFLIISVMQSAAQPAEQSANPSTTTVARLNIAKVVEELGKEFCLNEEVVDLDFCQVPPSASEYDPRVTVSEARAWTMDQLLRSNAGAMASQARAEVLQLQIAEEQLRKQLLQLQLENGTVMSADAHNEAMVGLESLDHGLMAAEDDIAQINDYLSELNNRLQTVEENNTLYLTVHNWCVTNPETSLCQALSFPE